MLFAIEQCTSGQELANFKQPSFYRCYGLLRVVAPPIFSKRELITTVLVRCTLQIFRSVIIRNLGSVTVVKLSIDRSNKYRMHILWAECDECRVPPPSWSSWARYTQMQ